MRSLRSPRSFFAAIGILHFGVPLSPAVGQTSQQIGAALEENALTWSTTGWTVGSLVRGRTDAMTATGPAEGERPVLRTTITGPAKVVFDWTVAQMTSVEVLGLSVDGHELKLVTPNDLWRCIELQIPAGTHSVEWRPLPGATVHLDKVIYDAGQTLGFVLGLNDGAEGVWAVHRGSFAQTAAAARDGLTSAAQIFPDADGRAVAYRLAVGPLEEAVLVSWWQRMVGTDAGYFGSPLLRVLGDSDSEYSSWRQRGKVASAGTWIPVEGDFLTGAQDPGALYLDNFTVEPLTLGRALDTPGLTWTVSAPDGVSWRVEGGAAPGGADGQVRAAHGEPFETTLATVVPGPGLLAFSYQTPLEPALNGTVLPPLPGEPDYWFRAAIPLPAGDSMFSLTARATDAAGGAFGLDQGNLLTPAEAPLAQALAQGAALPSLWVSQAGGVTRDEENVRGSGATVCLTPERGRVSEFILDVTGPVFLSFFTKSEPGAELQVYRGTGYPENLASYGGGSWEVRTLEVPAGVQRVHFIASGARVWLDDLMSVQAVPLVEALDVSSNIPGAAELANFSLSGGFAAQLPPGSGAVGDDAVIFQGQELGQLAIPFYTAPARIRFRCLISGYLSVRHDRGLSSDFLYGEGSDGPPQWREVDLILPGTSSSTLLFLGNDVWLDHLRLHSIAPRPWAEAGIPSVGVPDVWQAFDNADRDNGICAVSTGFGLSVPISLPLAIPGACDVSASWRHGRGAGPYFKFHCGPQSAVQYSNEWQPLHVHMDEPVAASFSVAATHWDRALGGEGMVDNVTITPEPPMAFSRALETDALGAGLQSPGWTAIGAAKAATTWRVSFDDEDALVVRPDPAFLRTQTTVLRASFGQTGFFHLRARGQGSGTACRVSWTPGSGSRGWRQIPLSGGWTLLRECVSGTGGSTMTIEITVDGNDPLSAVYLDTFGWEGTPATGELLEAPAFTAWTSAPAGAWTGSCHPLRSGASATGMQTTTLPAGDAASFSGTVTGPGYVVFATSDKLTQGEYTLDTTVDGAVTLSRRRIPRTYGPDMFVDQVFVPAGSHTVSWTLRAAHSEALAAFQLLSVSLVPGEALPLLTTRLPASEGWRFSEEAPPEALYNLNEGVLTPGGVGLPVAGSWIERDFPGPAEINTGWYSNAGYWEPTDGGSFTVNGHSGGNAHRDSYQSIATQFGITKGVSIPPGVHTFRWSRVQDTSSALALGLCEVRPAVISVEDAGPVVWINENASEFRWKSVPGNAFAGTTALSARDTAHGECLLTGPGVLSFMLAQDGRSIFTVHSEAQSTYYFSSDSHDWHYVSLLIPPGPQRIRFSEDYCEPTDGTEIAWIDNMKFTPGGFAQWRLTRITNPGPDPSHPLWGSGWEHRDSDSDGVTDELEFAFGTNPATTTAANGPASTMMNGMMHLQFPALPYDTNGLRYLIESSSDMLEWEEVARLPASQAHATGPSFTVPDAPRRYLRSRPHIE